MGELFRGASSGVRYSVRLMKSRALLLTALYAAFASAISSCSSSTSCTESCAENVSVHVTNAATGAPICDAVVTIAAPSASAMTLTPTQSNAAGCFYVGNESAAGPYVITASHSGFHDGTTSGSLAGDCCPSVQTPLLALSAF